MDSLGVLAPRSVLRGFHALMRDRDILPSIFSFLGTALLCEALLVLLFLVHGLSATVRSEAALRLATLPTARPEEVQELFLAIEKLPGVRTTLFVTKEQAEEQIRTRDPSFFSLVGAGMPSAFRNTIVVTLKDPRRAEAFLGALRSSTAPSVLDPSSLTLQAHVALASQFLEATEAAASAVTLFLALAVLLTFVVLLEFVARRARARRDDLLVEQLVGAPFLGRWIAFATEAAALFAAASLGSAFLLFLLWLLMPLLASALSAGVLWQKVFTEAFSLTRESLPLAGFTVVFLLVATALGASFVALRMPRLRLSATTL